jgi:hypothetical protein
MRIPNTLRTVKQRCATCQQEVSLEYFAPSRRGRAGQRCNPCEGALRRERYKADPEYREKNNRKLRAWKENNRDRFNAAQRKHYEANKESMDRASEVWRKANPEKHQAAIRKWHKENPIRSYAHTLGIIDFTHPRLIAIQAPTGV